ncbi:hypothetical protein D1007_15368 [Hordeum vulgare]|nr:hypothetical protein D1007_15368 [Hordeum vulgare]
METSGSKSSAYNMTMADKSTWVDDLIGKLNPQEREEDDLNFDEEFPDEVVDLPPMYRKEQVVRSLTRKVGEVMSVMLNPRWGNGRIVRIRVKLDVNEPLMRFVSITKNQRKVYYSILYEKMLVFCYVCGHMGHTFLEHGNGKHDKESMAWGDWILAPRSGSQPQGSIQNTLVGQKPNPQGRADSGKASAKELQDDASIPLKAGDGNKNDGEKSRKREKLRKVQVELNTVLLGPLTDEAAIKQHELHIEIEEMLEKEELYWMQRGRADWLAKGDQNTGFFHRAANGRNKRSLIVKIRGSNGDWVDDLDDIHEHISSYFSNLFTSKIQGNYDGLIQKDKS